MLSKLKTFAAVAVVAMAFVGCAKEETSMSIYDLAGRAKIKGFVSYNAKDSLQEDGHIEGFWIPKSDVEILAKISNAAISGNEDNEGYTEFRTRTNKEGYYEFEIPVPEKAIKVALRTEIFEGVRTSYDSLVNNKFYCSDKEGIFTSQDTTITIGANEIKSADFWYQFSDEEIGYASSRLIVNVFKGIYINGKPTFVSPTWSSFNVTIADEKGNVNESQKTDEKGQVIFDIVPSRESVEFTITVDKISSSAFLPGLSKEINGSYKQFYDEDYQNWNTLENEWSKQNRVWEIIENSLEVIDKKYEDGEYNIDEYNNLRMKTKKSVWMNETGEEWNEEWNKIWKREDIEKLQNNTIKSIWDKSFVSQKESVSTFHFITETPNDEDYPIEEPKYENFFNEPEPNKEAYENIWDYQVDWYIWNSKSESAKYDYRIAHDEWEQGLNAWKIENTKIKGNALGGDVTINVYMVFDSDNLQSSYKIENAGEDEGKFRNEYDYYKEWIKAFYDKK